MCTCVSMNNTRAPSPPADSFLGFTIRALPAVSCNDAYDATATAERPFSPARIGASGRFSGAVYPRLTRSVLILSEAACYAAYQSKLSAHMAHCAGRYPQTVDSVTDRGSCMRTLNYRVAGTVGDLPLSRDLLSMMRLLTIRKPRVEPRKALRDRIHTEVDR